MKTVTSLGAALIIVFTSYAALAEQARYRCKDGSSVAAKFDNSASGGGSVALSFGKNTSAIILPQALSADGGRYAGKDIEFWIKGTNATLTRGNKITTCATH
jgi:membrane-bound inhibitor of C-type lysozyme